VIGWDGMQHLAASESAITGQVHRAA